MGGGSFLLRFYGYSRSLPKRRCRFMLVEIQRRNIQMLELGEGEELEGNIFSPELKTL